MEVLLFGGTTEGRLLAEWLTERGCAVTLCVATEYGAQLLPKSGGVKVLTGRMAGTDVARLMATHPFLCVIDATHPYAVEVSRNVRLAAELGGLPYHRLVRELPPEGTGWRHVADAAEAAEQVAALPGNILLTTGSKDLERFARPGLLERVFPRVLPSIDSLAHCLELGFPAGHVLCMQGPFSQALNLALMEQYAIKTLVTKASGGTGGFWEKAGAAAECGAALVVIDRPGTEVGMDYGDMTAFLAEKLEGLRP